MSSIKQKNKDNCSTLLVISIIKKDIEKPVHISAPVKNHYD